MLHLQQKILQHPNIFIFLLRTRNGYIILNMIFLEPTIFLYMTYFLIVVIIAIEPFTIIAIIWNSLLMRVSFSLMNFCSVKVFSWSTFIVLLEVVFTFVGVERFFLTLLWDSYHFLNNSFLIDKQIIKVNRWWLCWPYMYYYHKASIFGSQTMSFYPRFHNRSY